MAVNKVSYLAADDPRRTMGPSPIIWGRVPFLEMLEDPGRGVHFFDDFLGDLTGWTETQATSGTVAVDTDETYGAIILDAGATTADQGIQVQSANSHIAAADRDTYFEVALKAANSAGLQLFAGLADDDTTVFAAGENSTGNHIGFECNATTQAATASRVDFYNEDGGTRTSTSTVHTLVDAAYVRLGFILKGLDTIDMYVNGVKNSTQVTSNIPTANMALTLACLEEGGSVQPTVTVDWIKFAQVIR